MQFKIVGSSSFSDQKSRRKNKPVINHMTIINKGLISYFAVFLFTVFRLLALMLISLHFF